MIDTRLFRQVPFSAGIASGLLAYLVMFGVLLVVPFYLERGLGAGTLRTGLELTVMPVFLGLAAPVAGRLADRFGARPLTVTGMVVVAAALGVLALTRPGDALLVAALAFVGVGLGLFTPSNNAAIMAAAPRSASGVASGVLNMTRGMGTALGLAVTGLVYGLAVAPIAGLQHSSLLLASIAAAAGLIASLRPTRSSRLTCGHGTRL